MNDPSAQPVDTEEQRSWLIDHRKATGMSWAEVAKRTGIPQGTLSQFGSERGYRGDEQSVAQKVYRYRQLLVAQAQIQTEAPEVPGYFETETSRRLIQMLNWGQRGRIVVAAMTPGTSKTTTARHFAACQSNVFLATMAPSTAGVVTMQIALLKVFGHAGARGTPQMLSEEIMRRVKDLQNPLLIFDEAQHLSERAIEEIRSWHDQTGVGVAFLGNIKVMQRLEGANRESAFAQLFSRVSLKMVQMAPLHSDADALAAAWNVEGDSEIGFIRKVAMMPGGLRSATMMLELAMMIAQSEKSVLALDHLQDAWAQLSSRPVAA